MFQVQRGLTVRLEEIPKAAGLVLCSPLNSPPYFPLVSVDPMPYLSEANSPAVVYLVLIWDNIYPKYIDLFCHEQNK